MERHETDPHRTQSLPEPLRTRMANDARDVATVAALLDAAERGLERCSGRRAHEREMAFELLVADARLTRACRHALGEGGGTAALAGIAARIARMDTGRSAHPPADHPAVGDGS